MQELRPGDHAALFYRNRIEQFATVIPYIQIGLERNERCLYIAGDNSVGLVINAMEAAGIDYDREQRNGRLIVATPDQTYLRHGIFEPQRMVDGLKEEVELSLRKGFSAFRGTGELSWATTLPSVLVRLYEYEQCLDANLAPAFVALCQYNETLFDSGIIAQMMRIHPKIVARGKLRENSFYLGPRQSLEKYPAVRVDELMGEAGACAV
jgi:chemotaxis family two-component system sensor kinase Cph1